MQNISRRAMVGMLTLIGVIVVVSVVWARGFAPNDACVGNARLISLALQQYTQDYDENLPPTNTPSAFQAALLPYVKNSSTFICPDTNLPYVPNAAISRRSLTSFAEPGTTVTFQDAQPHEDGKSTVAFLDNHIERGGVEAGDPTSLCVYNAHQIGLAMIQYVQDYDERYPPLNTTADLQNRLSSYSRSQPIFTCPVTHLQYTPNTALSGQTLAAISSPATTFVARDAQPHPDGVSTTVFADGHVERPGFVLQSNSTTDEQNQKELMLGVMQYVQDYDERLPTTTNYNTFEAQIYPYGRNSALFMSPSTGLPYQLNPAVSGEAFENISDPAGTEFLQDTTLNSDGTFNTAYVNGHVATQYYFVAKALAVRSDNTALLEWGAGTGLESLWRLSSIGQYVSRANLNVIPPSGPLSFLDTRTIAIDSNNKTYLLRSVDAPSGIGYATGTGELSIVSGAGRVLSHQTYGPYDGWTPVAVAVAVSPAHSQPRLLWARYDGSVALWTATSTGAYYISAIYPPATTLTAVGLAIGTDNKSRILWNKADGSTVIWTTSTRGTYLSAATFAPQNGWTSTAITIGPDNRQRILRTNTDGEASIETLSSSGAYLSSINFPADPGWTANALGVGRDGNLRVLWNKNDGNARVRTVRGDGAVISTYEYPPYQ